MQELELPPVPAPAALYKFAAQEQEQFQFQFQFQKAGLHTCVYSFPRERYLLLANVNSANNTYGKLTRCCLALMRFCGYEA